MIPELRAYVIFALATTWERGPAGRDLVVESRKPVRRRASAYRAGHAALGDNRTAEIEKMFKTTDAPDARPGHELRRAARSGR